MSKRTAPVRTWILRRMRLASALFGMVLLGALPTFAQTASGVTPDSFQPPLRNLSGAVVFSGQPGTKAPPGAEQIGITLSGVVLEGAFPDMAAANAGLEARLTRGRIPVSELFDATTDLEAAYAKNGYVLARVVLPQQTLRDGGKLRVSIVDGYVEDLDISKAPPEVRKRIETLTKPLVGRKSVTLTELERQLLLAGDVSGVALGSALTRGAQPGGTVIALDPQYRKVTGFVGFDNFAPDSLGELVVNSGFELNSALSFGETVYGRISTTPKGLLSRDPRYRILAFGALVPVGPSGLALNFEVTTSDTTPSDANTRSNFDRQSLRLAYPWIRSRKVNFTTQLMLDHATDTQVVNPGAIAVYKDELTVLRAAASFSYSHEDGALSEAGLIVSRGIDALGARTAAAATGTTPLSRQGADAVFKKLAGSFSHQRHLGERFALSVTGRFQTSFGDPLLTSEQFSIAGPSELSAFDSGSLRGDGGWVLRAEFSNPQSVKFQNAPLVLSPFIFGGVGAVTIEQPTAAEVGFEKAQAYGVGVDIISQTGSRFRSSSLRMEIAKGDRDNGPTNTRFSISGNYRF